MLGFFKLGSIALKPSSLVIKHLLLLNELVVQALLRIQVLCLLRLDAHDFVQEALVLQLLRRELLLQVVDDLLVAGDFPFVELLCLQKLLVLAL